MQKIRATSENGNTNVEKTVLFLSITVRRER